MSFHNVVFLRNVRERLATFTLNDGEYFEVLEGAAAAGVFGGTTYDAGHVAGYARR